MSAPQGKLLHLLARMIGARKILEIGTLGGYSAIWLARALPPGGRLVTLEYEQKHADVARQNIARAGLADRVDIRVGPAHRDAAETRGRRRRGYRTVDAGTLGLSAGPPGGMGTDLAVSGPTR